MKPKKLLITPVFLTLVNLISALNGDGFYMPHNTRSWHSGGTFLGMAWLWVVIFLLIISILVILIILLYKKLEESK